MPRPTSPKIRFSAGFNPCNRTHFKHYKPGTRQKRPSRTQGKPCAKTWNGSEAPGRMSSPAETEPRFTGYLTAVYGLVAWWAAEGRELDRARRALRLQRLEISDREDPFSAIIRCTADPGKADKRTRSKWSRVMRYAAAHKPDLEALNRFIRRKGGINACAAGFSRQLGRRASGQNRE